MVASDPTNASPHRLLNRRPTPCTMCPPAAVLARSAAPAADPIPQCAGPYVEPEADPEDVVSGLESLLGSISAAGEALATYNSWQGLFDRGSDDGDQLMTAEAAANERYEVGWLLTYFCDLCLNQVHQAHCSVQCTTSLLCWPFLPVSPPPRLVPSTPVAVAAAATSPQPPPPSIHTHAHPHSCGGGRVALCLPLSLSPPTPTLTATLSPPHTHICTHPTAVAGAARLPGGQRQLDGLAHAGR